MRMVRSPVLVEHVPDLSVQAREKAKGEQRMNGMFWYFLIGWLSFMLVAGRFVEILERGC